jgi:aspartate aminotransferase
MNEVCMKFSEQSHVAPSATIAINTQALLKKAAGIHVYNFAAGDPVLRVHPAATSRAEEGLRAGFVPYTPIAGIPDLRREAAHWVSSWHNAEYSAEETIVTCGGKHVLSLALQALIDRGDEVLFAAPYWVSYPDMVKLFGGTPKAILTKEDRGWRMGPDELSRALTAKSKVLIFNNPCNPTGVLYTKEEIAALLEVAKKAHLVVIADEVYSNLVYDGEFASCGMFHNHRDHLLIVQSCSKNFGMAGWRVGFGFGPEALIKRMATLQGQSTTGTSLVSQWAALGALKEAKAVNNYVKEEMQRRRDLFVRHYQGLINPKMKAPPAAIYYFAPTSDFRAGSDCVRFCQQALEVANVALVPGVAFGMEGFMRFAFSEMPDQIVGGIEALSKLLTQK